MAHDAGSKASVQLADSSAQLSRSQVLSSGVVRAFVRKSVLLCCAFADLRLNG